MDCYRWDDTHVDAEEYYSVDTKKYLLSENDTLVGFDWIAPDEITVLDSLKIGDLLFIKLRADKAGNHNITLSINSVESGRTQKLIVKIKLTALN